MFNKITTIRFVVLFIIFILTLQLFAIDSFALSNKTSVPPKLSSETIEKTENTDYSLVINENIRVYDYAEILSEEEVSFLTEQSLQFDNYNLSMLFLTIKDADGKTTKAYVDSFYDTDTFGPNSIMFVIDLDNEIAYINTTGHCIKVLSNNSMKYVLDNTYYYARQGKYYDFFKEGVNLSSSFILKNSTKSYFIPSVLSLTLSLAITLFIVLFLIFKRNTVFINNKTPINKITGNFNVLTKNTVFIGDKTNVLENFYKN